MSNPFSIQQGIAPSIGGQSVPVPESELPWRKDLWPAGTMPRRMRGPLQAETMSSFREFRAADGGVVIDKSGIHIKSSTSLALESAAGAVAVYLTGGVDGALFSIQSGKILSITSSNPTTDFFEVQTHLYMFGAQLELRFSEVGPGPNYVGFKAPSSIVSNQIWTLPSADGAANEFLQTNGSGVLSFAAGGGDVTGPSSAVDESIAVFDGISGKILKTSGAPTINSFGNIVMGVVGGQITDLIGLHPRSGTNSLIGSAGAPFNDIIVETVWVNDLDGILGATIKLREHMEPISDGSINLGSGSLRYLNIYGTTLFTEVVQEKTSGLGITFAHNIFMGQNYISFDEGLVPATPGAAEVLVFARLVGGQTELAARFDSGNIVRIAIDF